MKKIIALILVALMLFTFVGCETAPTESVSGDATTVTPEIPTVITELPDPAIESDYIIKIDGEVISPLEYRETMLANKAYFDNYDTSFWTTEAATEALAALKESVEYSISATRAIEQVAADNGIVYDEEKIATITEETEAAYLEQFAGDETALNEALYFENLTMDFLVEQSIINSLMGDLYMIFFGETGIDGTIRFTAEEMIAFTEENSYVAVKHILVTEEGLAEATDADGNAYEDLEAYANDIAQRAQAGDDFDTLITTYGEDPGMEASPQGYLFTYGEMVEEFEMKSFEIEEGEISDPVLTDYGYHIIFKLPINEETIVDFETTIMPNLADTYVSDVIEEVRTAYDIEYLPEYDALDLESFVPGILETGAVG